MIKTVDGIAYPLSLLTIDQTEITSFAEVTIQLPAQAGLACCLPSGFEGSFVTTAQTFWFPLASADFSAAQTGTLCIRSRLSLTEGGLFHYPWYYRLARIPGYGVSGLGQCGYGVSQGVWQAAGLPACQLMYVPFNSGIRPVTVSGFTPQRVR